MAIKIPGENMAVMCMCVIVYTVFCLVGNCSAAGAPGEVPGQFVKKDLKAVDNGWYLQLDRGPQEYKASVSGSLQASEGGGSDSAAAQESGYTPVQEDAQFEYELSLVAEQLQRDIAGKTADSSVEIKESEDT